MRFHVLATLALAEMRLSRRLLRYWIFALLAVGSGLLVYLYYCTLHAFFSSFSATAASIGPRYLIGAMGLYFLALFMAGLVFLAFDVRARDRREGIVEVLDSRPYSNAELLTGRFLGLLLMAWIPAFLMVFLMEVLGFLLPALGAPIGETLEPFSLVGFLFSMCLPALAWTTALTFFVTLLVRHRLVASLLSLLLIGASIWASFRLPPVASVFFDVGGTYVVTFPSDMLPGVVDFMGLLQRCGILVLSLAFLALAVLIHPRRDGGSTSKKAAAATLLMLLGIGLLGASATLRFNRLDQLQRWRRAHEAEADRAGPDILEISGSIRLDPGHEMHEDLKLRLRTETDLEELLFTFNPGLKVTELDVAGKPCEFHQADGFLRIDLPLGAGEEAEIHLVAGGRLDTRFGYLDAVRTPEKLPGYQAQLYLLGFERAINDSDCMVLMPGVAWLPISGSAVESKNAPDPGRDFFDVDLEVEIPEALQLVGPGIVSGETSADGFRKVWIRPGEVLDGVALVAAEYVEKHVKIEGVDFALYLSPKHAGATDSLAEARDEIVSRVSKRLRRLHDAGQDYPYPAFSLVEVPNVLRGFGGGWRLPSVLAPPGMMFLRELGFPTARFDAPFRDRSKFKDVEGGVAGAKARRVEDFFANDFSGGNLFAGFGRSLLSARTGCSGRGSAAVDWSLDSLQILVLSGVRSYFSAHLFTPEMNGVIGKAIQHYIFSGRKGHFADSVINAFNSRPKVWSSVMDRDLLHMDPWEDPQGMIDALSLKAGTLGQVLYDALGEEGGAALLARLMNRRHGQHFSMEEFLGMLDEEDPALGAIAKNLLESTGLPGFVAGDTKLFRLEDDAQGLPRYQLELRISNPEEAPGVFRMAYVLGTGDTEEETRSKPIPIGAGTTLRWSKILSSLPHDLRLLPYVSLNRRDFEIPLPECDAKKIVDAPGHDGVEILPLEEIAEEGIIIDDLDEGFSVEQGQSSGFRLRAKLSKKEEMDGGLPVDNFGPMPRRFSRAEAASAWGRYRHTVAWTRKGAGKARAIFSTTIPSAGEWRLEIHLPSKSRFRFAPKFGSWKVDVVNGGQKHSLSFDAENGETGWNLVDSIHLEAGDLRVEIPDSGTGMIVVADAIRLLPQEISGETP